MINIFVEEGKVVETNPKAGSSVKEKSKVVLKVSAGKDTVKSEIIPARLSMKPKQPCKN